MSKKAGTLGNENAQAILRAREKTLAAREKADLLAVLATPAGRRLVWSLIENAGVFGPSYASEALATAYNEGRRSVGIGLQVRCQRDAADLYVQALQEQLAELKVESTTREVAEATPEEKEEE